MYPEIKRSAWYRLTAWLLTVCLVITLIPDISHATGAGGGTKISPEDVTEKNVTGKMCIRDRPSTARDWWLSWGRADAARPRC